MNFSQEELINMVYVLGESERNSTLAARIYHQRYPNMRQPAIKVFEKLRLRFEETGNIAYKKKVYNHKSVFNEQNELNVMLSLEENPHISVRQMSAQSDISKSSINRIINKHKYHPYHIAIHQELHDIDFLNRLNFCHVMQEKINTNHNFLSSILFSDEATFKSNGLVNRHNMHYYAIENPHWLRQVDNQRVWSLNVWGGIIDQKVIGPYFFDGSITGEIYLNFLNNDLPLLLEDVDLQTRQEMWLQQDGAPAHYHRIVRNYLDETFENRWIGRGGPILYPARSPDLTPLDFFLWGYVKQEVYRDIPTTVEDMKARVRAAFASIRPETLVNVQQTFQRRLDLCIQAEGNVFEHAI